MNAMILAAGKGTRLYPIIETLAKPMGPIDGRLVLEHTIRWLRDHGVRRVAVNLHHRPESVRGHFGDGSRFGLEISYSEEPELLGTAAGVKRLEAFFEDTFLVVYGDLLTDLDLGALVARHRSVGTAVHATLAVDRRPDVAQGGVVVLDADNRIRRFVEKPRPDEIRSPWVNSGVMVLDRALLARIPAGRFSDFGREVLPAWLAAGVPLFACHEFHPTPTSKETASSAAVCRPLRSEEAGPGVVPLGAGADGDLMLEYRLWPREGRVARRVVRPGGTQQPGERGPVCLHARSDRGGVRCSCARQKHEAASRAARKTC
jgi:mannose-1-phosphate guanylyltransferase